MKNKLLFIFVIMLILFIIFIPQSYAVTEKQRAVGETIVRLAKDFAKNNEQDFAYSFYWGKDSNGDPVIMESVMRYREKANFAGIKYSGYIYGSTPSQAGINGRRENKFFVYCATYTRFLMYYATSKNGVYPSVESGERKFESLIPGDMVGIKQVTVSGFTNGHEFIYLDDAGDDDPYTMTVAQAPGTDEQGNRLSIEVGVSDYRGIATSSNTKDFYISSVERISQEAAEAISYNILNASSSLYDRLDNDKPVVNSVSHTSKGEINIVATDTKTQKHDSSYPTGVIRLPVSEPANSGIVAYQITKSTTEPTTNWIKVATTTSLELTTPSVESNGTYYVWVLDVGGNTNYKEVIVSDVNFDATPPSLGTPTTKISENNIELEITGATDESGISLYEFYLNGNVVASQPEKKYVYTDLQDGTEYTLSYKITDINGNTATSANIVVATNVMKISETYLINGSYISKIKTKTSLQNFMKNINSKVQPFVYTIDGQELNTSALIGTGMELRTAKKGNFVIIVTGDITGEGKLTATDILKLKEKLVGLETFSDASNYASDVDYNNNVNITDLLKMKKALVGLISL